MIDKRDVQAFFDRLAPDWDAGMVRNEAVIARILDNAGVCEGCTVLDVACGTGVLFGDYVKRGAARVTAVDLSPEMAARAAEKAAGTQITVVCGDVEDSAAVRDSGPYDVVMVYNAFPHFPDPAGLIRTLAELVRPGGRLSIAVIRLQHVAKLHGLFFPRWGHALEKPRMLLHRRLTSFSPTITRDQT